MHLTKIMVILGVLLGFIYITIGVLLEIAAYGYVVCPTLKAWADVNAITGICCISAGVLISLLVYIHYKKP